MRPKEGLSLNKLFSVSNYWTKTISKMICRLRWELVNLEGIPEGISEERS
jgi:hypothetical protein